jgi:endonuclease/exonuclease/phosphatase (EEP) superfamily protein YafD
VRLVLRPFVFVAAVGVGILGVVAWLPSAWWAFELVASWRTQIVVAAVVVALVALLFRGRVSLVIAVLTLVLCAPSVVSALTRGQPEAPEGGTALRVGHLNLQAAPLRVDDLIAEIRSNDTDVFVVMSVRAEDRANLPSRAGGYRVIVPPLARDLVVFTRARVAATIDPYVYALPGSSVSFAVELRNGTRVSLLALHVQSPLTPNRTDDRNVQLRAIADWAADQPGASIVFGDLNTTPWSTAFDELLGRSELVSSLDGFGLQPSWPARFGGFGIAIDHLLHSQELVTVARSTGRAFGSQHRSLWVTLAVR